MKKILSLLIALSLSTPVQAIKDEDKNLLNAKPVRVLLDADNKANNHSSIFEDRKAKREEVNRTKPKYQYQGEVLKGDYYKDLLVNSTTAVHSSDKENSINFQNEDHELTPYAAATSNAPLKPCLKRKAAEPLDIKALHTKIIASLNLNDEQEKLIRDNCMHCNPENNDVHSNCEVVAKYLDCLNSEDDLQDALEVLLLIDTEIETEEDKATYKAYVTLPDELKLPALMGIDQSKLNAQLFRDTRICAREMKNKSAKNLTSVSIKFFIVSEYFWGLYADRNNTLRN